VNLPVFRRTPEGFVAEKAVNICTGGLAVATREMMAPGSVVEMILTAPDGYVEVPVQCRVVHTLASPSGAPYLAGLQLTHVDFRVVANFESLLLHLMAIPEGHRVWRRLEVRASAEWRAADNPEQHRPVEVVNFGYGGALLRGPGVPERGQPGHLVLPNAGDDRPLGVPALAAWSRREPHQDIAGIRFQGDSDVRASLAGALRHFLLTPRQVLVSAGSSQHSVKVAGFEVGDLVGRGGMCDVYRGRGIEGALAGQVVALKRLRPDAAKRPGVADRFLTESDLGRMLSHPGLVRVHTAASFGAEHWMAMEFVDGYSLARVLTIYARSRARPPLEAMLSIGVELLETLDYCHTFRGPSGRHLEIVHGDVSPANVLVSRVGAVKLMDFGVASTNLPEMSDLAGIPYLAPELSEKGTKPTRAADIYQVGVLLYEALTGVRPFKARTPEELPRVVERGPMRPQRLNPDLNDAVEKALLSSLAANPKKRPRSAAEFAELLQRAMPLPRGEDGARVRAEMVSQISTIAGD
jgi:eukaryotic-like serine/threonine-protein kinase